MSERLEKSSVFEEFRAKLSYIQQQLVDLSERVLATRSAQETEAVVVELPLDVHAAKVEEILRTGMLKDFMPQAGETLSDKENPELFPDLGLVVGKANVSAVKIVAGRDAAQEQEQMRRVGLHFYYDEGLQSAILEVSAMVLKAKSGVKTVMYSTVHSPDYHAPYYRGHNYKSFIVDEEDVQTICNIVEGLLLESAKNSK